MDGETGVNVQWHVAMEHNLEQESVMMEIAKIKALALKFNTKIVTWVAAQVCNLNNL